MAKNFNTEATKRDLTVFDPSVKEHKYTYLRISARCEICEKKKPRKIRVYQRNPRDLREITLRLCAKIPPRDPRDSPRERNPRYPLIFRHQFILYGSIRSHRMRLLQFHVIEILA